MLNRAAAAQHAQSEAGAMTPEHHDSDIEDFKAAARLMRSDRVRVIALWFGGAAWSAFMAIGGWAARTYDLHNDMTVLRLQIGELEKQQIKLITSLNGDERNKGFIPETRHELRGLQRDMVDVAGIALAYTPEKYTRAKLDEGEKLADAYDKHLARTDDKPATVAWDVIREVAVAHTR